MSEERVEVAILTGGPPRPALDLLVRHAVHGIQGAGADAYLFRAGEEEAGELTERILGCDALLLAAPVVLFGLPGDLKSLLDGWLDLLPVGRLVPRTSRMRAATMTVYAPDDPEVLEVFHDQCRRIFGFLGMSTRGRVAGFAAEGAAAPREGHLTTLAERMGAILAQAGGGAVGYPPGYLAGADLFNRGEFYEAHEAWEEVWHEDEGPHKAYYQALIQVAAGFHHYGRRNWRGLKGLLDQAVQKLHAFRPRTLGLDVDGLLEALEPWHRLANARVGGGEPVTRIPAAPPRIEIDREEE
ncbi:MAG: DUF309 domain-containing protein [Planctomycetota bacterium]